MNFTCYGVTLEECDPFVLDVTIPSLASDANAEYQAVACLSTDFHNHHLNDDNDDDSGIHSSSSSSAGVNRETSISAVAAGSIQQSVELELLAAGLVSDIGSLLLNLSPISLYYIYPLSHSITSIPYFTLLHLSPISPCPICTFHGYY